MTIQRAYRRWKAALLRARLAREEEVGGASVADAVLFNGLQSCG